MYKTLLKLDGPVLKSDHAIIKLLKRKVLKPIGYWARVKNYNKTYK
jgi:hypothetical protein